MTVFSHDSYKERTGHPHDHDWRREENRYGRERAEEYEREGRIEALHDRREPPDNSRCYKREHEEK